MNSAALSAREHSSGGALAMRVAVVGALSATTMLFASLSSAYMVRRSFPDWQSTSVYWPVPLLLCALLASVGVEVASRAAGKARRRGLIALALSSGLYLGGALSVIISLVRGEAGLAPPHIAFAALLLCVHGVHALLGGALSAWILIGEKGGRAEHNFLVRLITHTLGALLVAIMLLLCVLR